MTLGGIERSNQGHWVFIGLCIIGNVLLDSGAVRPRGPLLHLSGKNRACAQNMLNYALSVCTPSKIVLANPTIPCVYCVSNYEIQLYTYHM